MVSFSLTKKELGFYSRDFNYVVEPGKFIIKITVRLMHCKKLKWSGKLS